MNNSIIYQKINELEKEIYKLPRGSINKKVIKGNTYYYNRCKENGKIVDKYIPINEVDYFREKINLRKTYEKEIKNLKNQLIVQKNELFKQDINIRIGENLKKFVKSVKHYKKRECYEIIEDFIYNDLNNKVLILYGLRRTGKTTLIRQIINEMNDEKINKTAFLQVTSKDTLANVNKNLRKLEELGFKYIFIDEVTLLEDFIEGSALFSDIYAASGMKIVLSGTDSLGFIFAKSDQLYDRCILVHTTFIPYREFENVLGIRGIDEYIRYGGTMSLSGVEYNDEFSFKNKDNVNEYVDSAIARNIQHSLKYYDEGNHFRHLYELYVHNELTNVINRVVEDINHRFTKEVLIKQFRSNDLAISARNLRKDINNPSTILDEIDIETFNKHLKQMLEILDINEMTIPLNDMHAKEIKEYLKYLDLIYEIDIRSFPGSGDVTRRVVISQAGIRYIQANLLVESLLLDKKFNELSILEKRNVSTRILNEIKGRMMEDIVLLETKISNPYKDVFTLQFSIGEFDMVVFDKETLSCEIYEIKHSKEVIDKQYRNLIDEEKIKLTEHTFGRITNKNVIYRGESKKFNNINYINVEEYLMNINKIKSPL